MAETSIEWTNRVWNFLRGCTIVSQGCAHCYAMNMAHRFNFPGGAYEELTELGPKGPRWTGRVRVVEEKIAEPLRVRKPQKWFVNSMSDLFHQDVPFEVIDRAFAVMALTPQHTYQILSKRPERMREYFSRPGEARTALTRWPLPNVWLGVSVEDQDALQRIDILKCVPAAVRFVSFEPLLEDLGAVILDNIHWAIIGGESGLKARSFDVRWARSLVKQCRNSAVACFVKQLGANAQERNDRIADIWYYADGSDMDTEAIDADSYRYQGAPIRLKLKSSKGSDWSEWPEDLRVREFPEVRHA